MISHSLHSFRQSGGAPAMTTGEYQHVKRKVAHIVRPDGSKSNGFRRISWTHKDFPGDTLIQVAMKTKDNLFSSFVVLGGRFFV
jgi:hypothetical protein